MKAATYSRYSTDMQREQSIEDQLRNCKKRSDQEGWKIITQFADKGISGSRTDRPQYQAMLAAAKRKEFDILLLDDLSRFGRDQVESERAIRQLEHDGIRIIAVSDGYDSTSKSRKVLRTVKGLQNEMYVDDLRDKTIRGLTGQVLKHYWGGGRPYGYAMDPILDPTRRDQYGNAVRVGTKLRIDKTQAKFVKLIFKMFVEGHGCKVIAAELNARGVPSPGSTWSRTTRRAKGWMNNAIREMLRNGIYVGEVVWNRSEWTKDPTTGARRRRERPESEWLRHTDESLRIIDAKTWKEAQQRIKASSGDVTNHTGGKPKYLLSGLLVCASCGAKFVLANAKIYACSSHLNGKACTNSWMLRRDVVERAILDPLREKLLAPEVAAEMVREMQRYLAERLRSQQNAAEEAPKELKDLDARLARLRARLKTGDPDMAPDELLAAIDKAEAKRTELAAVPPKASAKLLAAIPGAAALYRKRIEAGLEGNAAQVTKARIAVRELLGGPITLKPEKTGLFAHFALHKEQLIQGDRLNGSGGRI